METEAANTLTGRRKPTILTIVAIVLAVSVVAGTFAVYRSLTKPDSGTPKVAYYNPSAGGSFDITGRELQEGSSPDQQRTEQMQKTHAASLGISQSEAEKRLIEEKSKPITKKPARSQVGTEDQVDPGTKPAAVADTSDSQAVKRQARPLSTGVGSILAEDILAARTGIPTGSVPGNSKSTEPGTANKAGEEAYLPLHYRQLLAQQREESSSASSGTPATATKDHSDTMPQFAAVKEDQNNNRSDGEKPPAGVGNGRAGSSAQIPVNVLPPFTLPIPSRIMNNFIVAGAGSDMGQTIIAQVDQDVYFRNRLQLPKGCRFIGNSGGVRDLDMVDITFFALQFPDGTQVSLKGQAYSPYDPGAPESYGMRGIIGEYEEPPLWSQLAPILVTGVQGYSQSNFDRLARAGVRVDGSSGQPLSVETTEKDRLFGAASNATDKLLTIVMTNLNRYRPRVRVRMGQPLLIILDDYVDLSKRSMMGFQNPLLNETHSNKESAPDTFATNPEVERKLRAALGGVAETDVKKATDFLNNGAKSAGAAVNTVLGAVGAVPQKKL